MDTWLLLRSAMQKKEGCANLVSSHWYYPMTLLPVAALDVRGTNVGGHGFFKKSNKSKSASQFYEDCMHEDQKENRDLRITTASVILWRACSPDYAVGDSRTKATPLNPKMNIVSPEVTAQINVQ